jgi:glycosyltransferase involved in cell wall biosynthesis
LNIEKLSFEEDSVYMNLVIVSDDFPEKNHQSYVFVEQLVIALSDIHVKVSVIAPQSLTRRLFRGSANLPKDKQYFTAKGNSYEVYRPYYLSAGTVGPLQRFYFSSLRRSVERVLRRIGHNNIDVVYGHFWHNANTLVNYSIKYNIPLFVACGESGKAIQELLTILNAEEKLRLANTVKGVISVSTENKNRVLQTGLSVEDKIEVIPNAVDKTVFSPRDRKGLRDKFGIKDTDFVICFVGGFINRKGSKRLSDAITQLNDPNIKSFFMGKAWSYDDCTPDCLGILLKDSIPHEDLPDYLSASDVFVLPTLNEGCCNAIVEALSCGLPVISSNLPFNDDILDETCSVRIDPSNVVEIKNAISLLKNDKPLRGKLAAGALKKSESLSIDTRAKRVMKFIQSKM